MSKCIECVDSLLDILSDIKNSLKSYGGKIVNETQNIIESIEDSPLVHFIDNLNTKIGNFTEKVADLFESNEMDWIALYGRKESNEISNAKRLRRWPLFVMLVCAIICLGSSAVFHWIGAHSKKFHDFFSRLDYAGISILIAGSCYPPYFYFFLL